MRLFTALALRTAWQSTLLCGKEPASWEILERGLGNQVPDDLRRRALEGLHEEGQLAPGRLIHPDHEPPGISP
jgi:hypothetical protein